VLDVPDPAIEEATDVIITVTSTGVCDSDLHLYGVLGAYLKGATSWAARLWVVSPKSGPSWRGSMSAIGSSPVQHLLRALPDV